MTIFTVSDSASLYDALAKATGGDTIELAAGDYGKLSLSSKSGFDITFDSPVTIISADPGNPAVFSEMSLNGAKNLTFDSVVFDYTYDSADNIWETPFAVRNSDDITIRNSVFDGDVASERNANDDGYGFAKGLEIGGSSGISIENNEFTTWHRGVVVSDSQDIVIAGNDIHSIRSDGMDFTDVQSVRIEDNYIHDFKGSPDSGDHMDMIQFWTSGTDEPSTNIIIRNNVLDIGDGHFTQSIFMRNEVVDQGLAGSEMFYQNVLIEENMILNGHSHGITVGETNGLTIRNNSVLSIDATDERIFSIPAINVASTSTSVSIHQNAVGTINGYDGQAGWSLSDNAYVQNADPDAPGYYTDLFLESSLSGPDGVAGYVVTPGSMLAILKAGSTRLLLDTTPDSVTPLFDVTSNADADQTLVFDATYTYDSSGQVLPEAALFIWDFGDGSTATGRVVEHRYDTLGNYDVTLKVLLNGQDLALAPSATAEIAIAGTDLLAFNAADGGFYLQGYGEQVVINNSDGASVATSTGMALDLGGTGTKLEIPKEALLRFFGTDAFKMSMTLQADQPGVSWGEVARIHSSIIITVQEDGNLRVQLFTDAGERISLISQGTLVNDGATHDISIVFDAASDSLQILIDDTVSGSHTVSGSMPSMEYWGLIFGQPWGGQNFDGKLSAFELEASSADYPIFEGELEASLVVPGPDGPVTEPGPDGPVTEPGPDGPVTEPGSDGTDDAGLQLPTLDDFVARFDQIEAKQLHDDAYVVATENGGVLHLDGKKDYVDLGRLTEFEDSEQLSFSIDFRKNATDNSEQRIVWNHQKVGLAVVGDALKIYVGQADTAFHKAIKIDDLGLDDTELHQVMVMIDTKSDHMQVIVDGTLVLDLQDRDFDFVGAGGYEWGWSIGTIWDRHFDGEVFDFRIDASAEFLPEVYVATDDFALMA